MAHEAKAPAMLAGAHHILGYVLFLSGQFPPAREHFECAVELFAAGSYRNYGGFFAQTAPNVVCGVLVILGYPSAALSRAREVLAVARQSSDPYLLATALFLDGLHHIVLRDTRTVAEEAHEMLSIATEHGMAFISNAATFFRGWTMAAAGRDHEGIAEMRQSLSDPMVAGSSIVMLAALAETCGQNGRAEEGLDVVAKGQATAEQTGHRMAEAELHRVKGELIMIRDPGNVAEAERSLRTAIEVARRQGARLFELRATVSLARLLKQQGKTVEARPMLREIYNWFTEGFDTADLKDAKALLDQLSGSGRE